MATYKNTTAFLSGGRLYSNNTALAANQSEQPQYAPPSNNTLALIQEQMADLSSCPACNGPLSPMPSCYVVNQSFEIDYLP